MEQETAEVKETPPWRRWSQWERIRDARDEREVRGVAGDEAVRPQGGGEGGDRDDEGLNESRSANDSISLKRNASESRAEVPNGSGL